MLEGCDPGDCGADAIRSVVFIVHVDSLLSALDDNSKENSGCSKF